MNAKTFAVAILVAAGIPAAAYAQSPAPGAVVTNPQGNTGGAPNVTVAPGATGASTAQSNSAAGSNAGQPERAVPQSSSGGSGSN